RLPWSPSSCDIDAASTRLNSVLFFFFQAEDGIRDATVTGVQTCALPISGCKVQRSRVLSVDIEGTKPRFSVEGEWHETDFLVLAAGARNQLVPGSRALQRDELEMKIGRAHV